MAGSVGGEGFWLPSDFLTDDDFLMGKENLTKAHNNNEMEPQFSFPTDFTYDFGNLGKTPLENLQRMSSSPFGLPLQRDQSNGSLNGVKSPQNAQYVAKYDAVEDLIYRASDQVVKLKLNYGDASATESTRLFGPPRIHGQFYAGAKTPMPPVLPNKHFQHKQQNEGFEVWYNQQRAYQSRGGCGGGVTAVKRASAGTGVFIPRRYGNSNDINGFHSDSQRMIGSSTAMFPGRAASQSHTKNFNNINGFAQSLPQQSQPRINRALVPDYDSFLLRRHALLLQERRRLLASIVEGSSMMGHDLCLPHEWTY